MGTILVLRAGGVGEGAHGGSISTSPCREDNPWADVRQALGCSSLETYWTGELILGATPWRLMILGDSLGAVRGRLDPATGQRCEPLVNEMATAVRRSTEGMSGAGPVFGDVAVLCTNDKFESLPLTEAQATELAGGMRARFLGAPVGQGPVGGVAATTGRTFAGIGRIAYLLLSVVVALCVAPLYAKPGYAAEVLTLLGAGAVSAMRLVNMGYSPWWALYIIAPLLNLFLLFRCLILPAGYAQTNKLDSQGKIAVALIIGGFVVAMVAMVIRVL